MTLTISKTKLKTHMLRIFRELEENGDDLIVTDRDRPILRVVQFQEKEALMSFSPCGEAIAPLSAIRMSQP